MLDLLSSLKFPVFTVEGQAYGGLSGMDRARQRIPEMQQQSNFKQWPSALHCIANDVILPETTTKGQGPETQLLLFF